MQSVIYKYQLSYIPGDYIISMPKGAEILSVGNSFNRPVLWARVDIDKESARRGFRIFFTGEDFPQEDEGHFIGTVIMDSGNLVIHVYDKGEIE